MANPFPDSIRREAWNLLREYKDVRIPGLFFITVGYVLNRLFGYDRGS